MDNRKTDEFAQPVQQKLRPVQGREFSGFSRDMLRQPVRTQPAADAALLQRDWEELVRDMQDFVACYAEKGDTTALEIQDRMGKLVIAMRRKGGA